MQTEARENIPKQSQNIFLMVLTLSPMSNMSEEGGLNKSNLDDVEEFAATDQHMQIHRLCFYPRSPTKAKVLQFSMYRHPLPAPRVQGLQCKKEPPRYHLG